MLSRLKRGAFTFSDGCVRVCLCAQPKREREREKEQFLRPTDRMEAPAQFRVCAAQARINAGRGEGPPNCKTKFTSILGEAKEPFLAIVTRAPFLPC